MMPRVGDVVTNKATGDSGVVVAVITEPPNHRARIDVKFRACYESEPVSRNVPNADGNTFSIVKTSPAKPRRYRLKVHTSAEVEIEPGLTMWISRSVSPGRLVVAISGPRTRTGLGVHEFVKSWCAAAFA